MRPETQNLVSTNPAQILELIEKTALEVETEERQLREAIIRFLRSGRTDSVIAALEDWNTMSSGEVITKHFSQAIASAFKESSSNSEPQSRQNTNSLIMLIEPINRLTAAIETLLPKKTELARFLRVDYESNGNTEEIADEAKMAAMLSISKRTLGEYRRNGRFPGCWIKNGRQIGWKIKNTMDAWRAGIS